MSEGLDLTVSPPDRGTRSSLGIPESVLMEFEQVVRAGDGQGSLACCGSWGHKELDTTELLNWTELNRLSPQIGLHPKNLTSHEL